MRESRTSYAPGESMTETEDRLARIWSELLERPSVAATDNFFDLGGHSLLAVLLLLRIREAFGVELSIDDVYSGTLTLSDLAARIETLQLGGIDPQEYAALLAEIEGLSDDEARQLLAAEDAGNA
jgi:acyl carrier protein